MSSTDISQGDTVLSGRPDDALALESGAELALVTSRPVNRVPIPTLYTVHHHTLQGTGETYYNAPHYALPLSLKQGEA